MIEFNRPQYNKVKPQYLYRGVTISYEQLKDFEFSGVTLKPPYPPKIDKEGRKTVGDGNEYGIYMSDNEGVAKKIYAKVTENDGTVVNTDVIFGLDHCRTMIPAIGVVYKINTDGLDVHIPWINSGLMGLYNNGIDGEEWIAEYIPDENYSIDSIRIGPDTLHEPQVITIENIDGVKEQILNIINKRIERLALFEKKIEAMSKIERLRLDSNKIGILKSIYKLKGIMDIDVNSFVPKTTVDYLNYLMAVTYAKDTENLDFTTLSYLQGLKTRVRQETTVEDIISLVSDDIERNEERKNSFVQRKEKNGESYTTRGFDNKNTMYSSILVQLNSMRSLKEKEEKSDIPTVDTQKLGVESIKEQEDTATKDRVERIMVEQMKNNDREKQTDCFI